MRERRRTHHRLLVVLSVLAVGAAVCRDATSSSAKPPLDLSLRDTYTHLRGWYEQRAVTAMRPYLDPDQSEQVLDLLISVDELLACNAGAQEAIRGSCPSIDAERFDMAALVDNLDLFSRTLEVVGEEEVGRLGLIRVRSAPAAPVRELRFERLENRWVYLPGPGIAELASIIRDIAVGLDRIRVSVTPGPCKATQIESEYRLRIGPKIARISQIEASPDALVTEVRP